MATYSTTGIVVGRTDFGEADRVVRFITPDHGKLSGVAKGVRRIKSRSGGHLELFGEVNLMLAEGRNLDVITSARLSWYPHHLAGNYEGLELAFMMATMIDRLVQEGQPNQGAYDSLREALGALDGDGQGPLLELWYKLHILSALGYQPQLQGCAVCGRRDGEANYWFSSARGGILDETCHGASDRPMSHAAIKLWRLLLSGSFAVASSAVGGAELATTSLTECDDFYLYHLGRTFTANYSGV